MSVTLAPVAPVLLVADICDLLKISHSQFYVLKDRGWFAEQGLLVEVDPPLDAKLRYHGAPFVAWLSKKRPAHVTRAILQAVEAGGQR